MRFYVEFFLPNLYTSFYNILKYVLPLGTESLSAMDDIFNVDPMTRSDPSSDRASRRRRREEEARFGLS